MAKLMALLCLFMVLLAASVIADGQEVPRWEVGPAISLIKIREFDSNRFFGFGGRGVLNFSRLLGADIQFSRAYHKEFFAPSNSRTEYSHDQFIASLKATWRPQNAWRINPFALAGMGLARDGVSSTFEGPFPGSSRAIKTNSLSDSAAGRSSFRITDSPFALMSRILRLTSLRRASSVAATHPHAGGIGWMGASG